MKQVRTLSPLLLASVLFTSAAFAQEQPAPAPEASEATEAAATAAPAADAAAAQTAAPAADVAAAPATDAAAAPAAAEAVAPVATQPTASGALNGTVEAALGAPKEGKARVVFFRPSKFVGGAVKFKVREGETELGQLSSGRYFVRNLAPGAHVFTVHSEAKDVTNVEVEAGETYFVAGSISMGVMVGRPNLAPSDAVAFEAALKKMKKLEVAD